jgi:hypothetical protein
MLSERVQCSDVSPARSCDPYSTPARCGAGVGTLLGVRVYIMLVVSRSAHCFFFRFA